jgi:hypothetical protein
MSDLADVFYRLTRRVLFSWPFFCILFHFILFYFFLRDFPDAAAIHLGVNGSGGDDPFFTSTASRLDLEPTTAGPHELSPGKYLFFLFFFFLLFLHTSLWRPSVSFTRSRRCASSWLFFIRTDGYDRSTALSLSLSSDLEHGEGRRESLFLVSRGLRAALVCAPGSKTKKKSRWEKQNFRKANGSGMAERKKKKKKRELQTWMPSLICV